MPDKVVHGRTLVAANVVRALDVVAGYVQLALEIKVVTGAVCALVNCCVVLQPTVACAAQDVTMTVLTDVRG